MISAHQVTRRFAEDTGVFDLSFEIQPGVIFGLVGPSGSGKTTTVRLLTGLQRPDKGELRVLGSNPQNFTTATRDELAYMPQQFVLYPTLTVWENLNFVASIYGLPYRGRRRRMAELLEFVELNEASNRLASQLSGGMQRRLMLACTLAHDPLLIFADEPTAGIDPVLRGRFWDQFRALRDAGRTLFVTTQYIGEVAYCDLVGVMRDGRLLYLDTPDGLRRRALRGEVVRLQVAPHQVQAAAVRLGNHELIDEVRRSRNEPGMLYLHTEDASLALPQIIGLLSQEPAIEVVSVEEYLPPFDEIFIMLMEQEDRNAAIPLQVREVGRG